MGGEQGPAADVVVQVLGDRPGERDAVERARAPADLVEDDQAARRGVVEDVGRLGHLDHERALAPAQLVGRADAGEEAVDDADPGPLGRDEAADLGQDAIRATWRMYVLLPAMFGPVMSRIVAAVAARAACRSGTKSPGRHQDVEHRMPAGLDLQDGLGDDLGPAVALPRRQLGQRRRGRRPAPAPRRPGSAAGPRPRRGRGGSTNSSYSSSQARSSASQDLVLVLLELGRDVPLGVLDRLLADEVGAGPSRAWAWVISM